MKKLWRPTLTLKEASAICGSLSNPSKMPGHGYALPAQRCRLGSLLQLIPKSVCHHCYALRGRYLFPVVRAAMERRFSSLSHPRWAEAVSTLIHRSGDRHFRWHDSGDLRDLAHLRNIVRVCLNLPRVKFWLPTREYQTVEAYRRMSGEIPSNLCIRYSAHLVDGLPPVRYGLPASGVHSGKAAIPAGAHVCPAPKQGMKCGSSRACWDPSVKMVSFHLKHGGSHGAR
jgi:Gene product 88